MKAEIELASNASRALAQAKTVLAEVETADEAKELYDRLEAMSQLARRYRLDTDKQNEIAKMKLRTARKGGAILAETVAHGGGDAATLSRRGTALPEGITRNMSSRWQTLVRWPEEQFEEWLETISGRGGEVTLKDALEMARDHINREILRAAPGDVVPPPPDTGLLPEEPWRWRVIVDFDSERSRSLFLERVGSPEFRERKDGTYTFGWPPYGSYPGREAHLDRLADAAVARESTCQRCGSTEGQQRVVVWPQEVPWRNLTSDDMRVLCEACGSLSPEELWPAEDEEQQGKG